MSRDRDKGATNPHVDGADRLDPALQELFDRAYDEELPVDVGARHLWTLYRSARTPVAGVLSAPNVGAVRRRMVNATLAIVVFLLPGLLGQASAQAMPGDLLYGVKRHHELTQLETAISWETRDQLLAQQAEQRLIEAQAIALTRPEDVAHVIADADSAIEALGASPVAESRDRAEEIRSQATTRLVALVDDIAEPQGDAVRVAIEELATPDVPDATGTEVGDREIAAADGVTEDAVTENAGDDTTGGSVPAGGAPSAATPGQPTSAPLLVPSEATPGSAATLEPEPMPSPREGPGTGSTPSPSAGPAGERPAAFPADSCEPAATSSPSTPPHVLDLERAACDDGVSPSTPPVTDTPPPTTSPKPTTPAPTGTPSTPPVETGTPPATDDPNTPASEPTQEPEQSEPEPTREPDPSEPSTPRPGSPNAPVAEVPRSVQETPAAPQPDPTPTVDTPTPADTEPAVPSVPEPAADPDPGSEPDSVTGPGPSSEPAAPILPSPATTTTPLPSVSPALDSGPQAADMTPTTAPTTP
jgi:hypothetical protein